MPARGNTTIGAQSFAAPKVSDLKRVIVSVHDTGNRFASSLSLSSFSLSEFRDPNGHTIAVSTQGPWL